MPDNTRIQWSHDNRYTIATPKWWPRSAIIDSMGWHSVERWREDRESCVILERDGQLRGAAAWTRVHLSPPTQSFGVTDPTQETGAQRWLLGSGLAIHPTAVGKLPDLIWNARILAAAENGDDGVVCPVEYAGWDQARGGGAEHYLQMVSYGTTRDPFLTPYLEAGFWVAGRSKVGRIAWLARATT